eukprot:6085400-Pyramimonas_sp.AAC.1
MEMKSPSMEMNSPSMEMTNSSELTPGFARAGVGRSEKPSADRPCKKYTLAVVRVVRVFAAPHARLSDGAAHAHPPAARGRGARGGGAGGSRRAGA